VVGWLVGLLAGWLAGWQEGRQAGWLVALSGYGPAMCSQRM